MRCHIDFKQHFLLGGTGTGPRLYEVGRVLSDANGQFSVN
jgi:hypothetical protein